ncbi:carboxypeptidase M32 [Oleisolibacter albus]|uniref:carboxypeptidase M32 n=1 Tax=Oleisolibacter albus TaxID=2171757 RepID=UPI000DF3D811|nr:carboxypeptidase M32 [Oleisolibacter albus]
MSSPAYRRLEARFARRSALQGAMGILTWDSRTMMPDTAGPSRAEQLAALEHTVHGLLVDPVVGALLAEAEATAQGDLSDWQQVNLREMRREHDLASALPGDLVEAEARAVSHCELVWREARRNNDFALLQPSLQAVLAIKREVGQRRAAVLGCGAYDALHDEFEPGSRGTEFGPLFDAYAAWLPGFLQRVEARQDAEPAPLPMDGTFPVAAQQELALSIARRLGYHGRIDPTLHAFCGGATGDVRITSRFDEADWFKSLKSSLHETGHALYELGRPADWAAQPVGRARGLAVHESQSLTFDMQVGRHPRFLEWLAPLLAQAYGRSGPAWTADNLKRRFRRVERSFIRVDADEVTYPAHVILRWRLEQAMIEGRLDLADLPDAWNQGFRDLLGVTPPDLARGCLQDVHWSCGLWGYFPTYTLGAMMAAQLFDAARRGLPGLEDDLARGDFGPLVDWLRAHVHRWGRFRSSRDLLLQATGTPLDAGLFQRHLETRYLA